MQFPILRAAAYWNRVLGQSVFLVAPYAFEQGAICRLEMADEQPADPDRPHRVEIAKTYTSPLILRGGTLHSTFVRVTFFNYFFTLDEVDQENVARHEFGHVLGLEHIDDTACLLYPDALFLGHVRDGCPSELDLARAMYPRE